MRPRRVRRHLGTFTGDRVSFWGRIGGSLVEENKNINYIMKLVWLIVIGAKPWAGFGIRRADRGIGRGGVTAG
jgi:hypothetical protein